VISAASGLLHRQRTDQGMLGDAIYFADDPHVAVKYTGVDNEVGIYHTTFYFYFNYNKTLRWHRRNANGSCYPRFLPRKLPKTVLRRTAAHDFLPNLHVTHNIFFQFEQGPATALFHLRWGSAQNVWCERPACRNEKFPCMGPTRNVFGLGPYIFFVRFTNRS